MTEECIACPHCGRDIQLTQAIAGDIRARLRAEYEKRLQHELRQAAEAERARLGLELRDLEGALAATKRELKSTQDRELELLQSQRALEERQAQLDLEVARRLHEERHTVEKCLRERLDDEHRLKDQEKDKKINDMIAQIDQMKRKAEQGSQQTQGEVAELDLEALLRSAFPSDEFEPVPKGRRGADLVQRVRAPSGRVCGTIVWERKQTRLWGADWIQKLKDDQRELRADLAALVSAVLPGALRGFGCVEGVWVGDLACTLGLAAALRAQLVQVAVARARDESRGTGRDLLYDYLTGNGFRQRVESLLESYTQMRDELEKEKRMLSASWAKREQQLLRALGGLAGIYGDVRGLAGTSLPPVAALELEEGCKVV